jgi:hypothetical protein
LERRNIPLWLLLLPPLDSAAVANGQHPDISTCVSGEMAVFLALTTRSSAYVSFCGKVVLL